MSGVMLYGTGVKEATVQELSERVAVRTRETVDWLKQFTKDHERDDLGAYLLKLKPIVEDNAAIDVPDYIYESVAGNIKTPEAALGMCRGVTTQMLMLVLNFLMNGYALEAAVKTVQTAQLDKLKAAYAASYSSILNFWFGWNHKDIHKNIKTRERPSIKDPIAVIRFVCYMRRYVSLSHQVDASLLSNEIRRVLQYNAKLTQAFFMQNGHTHLVPSATQNFSSMKNNFTLIDQERKGGSGRQVADKAMAEFLFSLGIPLLDCLMLTFRVGIEKLDTWFTGDVMKLVSKYITQQLLWSWGGVVSDFERDVVLNSVPGMEKIDKKDLFFYLAKESLTNVKEKLDKKQRDLWFNLAWVNSREDMILWLKTMWPDAFDGKTPAGFDIDAWSKDDERALQTYSTCVRAYFHPVFNAYLMETLKEITDDKTYGATAAMMESAMTSLNQDINRLATTTLVGATPHFLYYRYVNLPEGKAQRDVLYGDYIKQLLGQCQMYKNATKTLKCVCDMFSYDDNLGLKKNDINLQSEINSLRGEISTLKRDKEKIMEAQAAGNPMIDVDGISKPCKEAYGVVAAKREDLLRELAQKVAQMKTLEEERDKEREKLKTCELGLSQLQTDCASAKSTAASFQGVRGALMLSPTSDDATVVERAKALNELERSVKGTMGITATGSDYKELYEKLEELSMSANFKTDLDTCKGKLSGLEDQNKAKTEIITKLIAITGADVDTLLTAVQQKYASAKGLEEQIKQDAATRAAADKAMREKLAKSIEETTNVQRELEEIKEKYRLEKEAADQVAAANKKDFDEMKAKLDAIAAQQPAEAQKNVERLMAQFAVRMKLDICNRAKDKLQKEYDALVAKYEALDKLHQQLDKDSKADKQALADCNSAAAALATKHTQEIDNLKQAHAAELQRNQTGQGTALADQEKKLKAEHDAAVQAHSSALQALRQELATKQGDISNKDARIQALEQAERDLAMVKGELGACKTSLQDVTQKKDKADSDLKGALLAASQAEANLKAQIATIAAERDALKTTCSGNAALVAQNSGLGSQLAAVEAERVRLDKELKDAQGKIAKITSDMQVIEGKLHKTTQELDMWKSGAPMPVAAPAAPTGPIVSTAMPAALTNMVQVGTRPERVFAETVDMMALGTSCADEVNGAKPAGCFQSADVPCDVPEQVIAGVCNYGTISVPLDINNVSLTYSVLDPGSKVKLQLQSALFKYNRAVSLIIPASPVILDRHLFPIKKLYDYDEIDSSAVAGSLKVPNMQYARYLDEKASVVARAFFELMHGREGGLKSKAETDSVGVEFMKWPNTMYKVDTGSFSGMYRLNKGDIVHPARIHIHPAYASAVGAPVETYSLTSKGFYGKSGISVGADVLESGMALLREAAVHLVNATMVYIGIAFDNKLVVIPSTSIPSGAFSMLPRADVDALLALAVLFPRTAVNQHVPDLSMDLGAFVKDDLGTAVSRARAATCEVLGNYSVESALTGDITVAAKTNPANRDIVMTEAAKRVAEIAMLAETMKK